MLCLRIMTLLIGLAAAGFVSGCGVGGAPSHPDAKPNVSFSGDAAFGISGRL